MKNADESLFERYLAGELPLEVVIQMIEGLKDSPEARADLLRLSLLETQLFETLLKVEDSTQANLLLQQISGVEVPALSSPAVGSQSLGQHAVARSFERHWLLATACTAALILIGLFIWRGPNAEPDRANTDLAEQQKDVPPVAYVSRTVEANWSPTSVAADGNLFPGGMLQLDSGLAEITFTSGARAILAGPAKLETTGPNSARLLAGNLVASVPPEATGFRVDTPTTTIIDIGTEFGMHVGDDGVAEIQVFRGEVDVEVPQPPVELANSAFLESIRLLEGENVRVDVSSIAQNAGSVERKLMRNEEFTRLTTSLVLSDDFEAPTLDSKWWKKFLWAPASDVRIRNGQAILINRGYLSTRDEFDPVRLGGIKISGRWTFLVPTDGEENKAINILSIVTRCSTQPGLKFYRAESGIEVMLRLSRPWPRIFARGNDLAISKDRRTGKIEGGFQVGRTYEFEVIDDGLNVLVRVTDVEDSTRWAESIAKVLRDESNTDHIVFYSREVHPEVTHYEVGLDDVKISTSTGPCR